uniref:substrate-binding and GGDEF domain-containing protein n=1 Tax=Acetatifactor sp. TaxID=1872090 RepID=UPI0040567D6A
MENAKKLIGICGVRIYEQNVMPFIQVLKEESEKRGYHIVSFSGTSGSYEDTEETIGQYQFIELIYQVDICALIILAETIINENTIQKLVNIGKEKNIPVFSLDRKVEGCYSLLMNNENCFEQIVRHVVEEHGCRRVNMIAGDEGERFSEERIEVYRKVLEENGIPFEQERIGHGNYWERPVVGVMKQFFDSELPFPEAIVCANDIMAYASISILNEYGMEAPEDVIVTGYDGTKSGSIYFPSITTGAPNFESTVEQIFDEIAKYFENHQIEPCDIVVPVMMQKHQSCGCERKIIHKKDRRISNLLDELGNGKWHMKSMHLMLSDTFGKQKIEEILPSIPKHMDVWFDFYRYVGIKTELFHSHKVTNSFSQMTSILEGNCGEFRETGKSLNISELQSFICKIIEEEKNDIILIHPLISGKDVYGFTVEGFEDVLDWQIKQCDEFAMFLSHILHTVIHNYKMNELNENLSRINKEIEEVSLRDSMTGIYNRRGFFRKMWEIIQKEENEGKYIYLFVIDMDGLKYINDNFGHAEGDYAIVTLANSLFAMGKGEAVCARVGGDEFICAYVSESEQRYNAQEFTARMEGLLKAAEGVADLKYPLSASVGMKCEAISESLDLDAMINDADDKMYQHKMARKKKR